MVVLDPFHVGLAVARTLGRLGVDVHGLHLDPRHPAVRSRYWRSSRTLASLEAEPVLGQLERLARELGRRPLLIPTDDAGVALVEDDAERLAERYLFPRQPAGLARALSDKRALHGLCLRHDVPTPLTEFPRGRDELEPLAQRVGFPLMLKGIDTHAVRRRTGVSMVLVHSLEELLARYDEMEAPGEPSLMLQEYVPGGADSVWMFNGYFDADSRCLFGATGRKLRQYPPYTGATSLGICERNDDVAAATLRFAGRLGYRGILDIGWRFDARDGVYKLLDPNPRVGATFRLFASPDGLDVVRALYLDLTGQPVPRAEVPDGRRWLAEHFDAVSSVRYHRDGVLPWRAWLGSLRGVDELAWAARDDPAPLRALVRRTAADGAARVRRAPARRPAPQGAATQQAVDASFDAGAAYWDEVYADPGFAATVHRARQAAALELVDGLGLPRGARVLEVGCGAGHLSRELAGRGFAVQAIDASPELVAIAGARLADEPGVEVALGDVHALATPDGDVDLVVALGVVPWLHSPGLALREIARVLRPDGHVVITANNRARLNFVLDPRYNPAVAYPLKRAAKLRLQRAGRRDLGVLPDLHYPARFDALLLEAGLEKVASRSVGFGPFSLLGRPLLSDARSVALQRRLQHAADAGAPLLRSTGMNYVVLARRTGRAASSAAISTTSSPRRT